MRDIAITLVLFGLIPVIFKYPWTGVLVYAWVSVFNPHKFAWGFANDFPFALIVAAATAVSMMFQWREVRLPINSITVLLIFLPLWMTVTTVFALEPSAAFEQWQEVMKKFYFVLVTASLLHSRKQFEALIWVLVLSIGFYGVKGGIFTLVVGGGQKVYGPPGTSFISDNNAISIALIMTIPLMQYLSTTVASRWIKLGMYGAMILSGLAVLGSQSRGAFLALLAMVLFLWLKSKHKFFTGIMFFVVLSLSIGFMPKQWDSRMESIRSYEQDRSAMGRLNTWNMLFNLANERPFVGGGFEPYSAKNFALYAPDPTDIHSAHSIYFQMLGEHGYVGLTLFLCLGIASWIAARRTIRISRNRSDCAWAGRMARSFQVSLIGFAAGGAFVNIAYWEVLYFEVVILMAVYRLVSGLEPSPGEGGTERKPTLAVT